MVRHDRRPHDERGFMMAALLVTMSVMAVLMGALLPVWSTAARREREEELVFRGEQYARAIMLFQRKYANARPPSVDVLLNERMLRKKYKDPITNDEFEVLAAGAGPPQPGLGGQTQTGQGTAQGQAGQGQRALGLGARTGGAGSPPQSAFGAGQPGAGQPGAGQPPGAGGLQAAQAQAAGGQGGPGLVGVVSKSKDQSLRIYKGQQRYSDWVFMPVQMTAQAGAGAAGAGAPGARGNPQGGPNGPRGTGSGAGGLPTGPGRGTGRGPQGPGDGRGFGQPPPGQRGLGGVGGRP
jgi:type II secretory pathway pseudopilin PulG